MTNNFKDIRRSVLLTLRSATISPEEITAQLKIEPDGITHKGKIKNKQGDYLYDKNNKVRKNAVNIWSLRPDTRRNATINKQLDCLYNKIKAKKKILARLLKQTSADISICVMPSRKVAIAQYQIDNQVLSKFAEIGINLHLVVYMPEYCYLDKAP